MMNMHNQNKFEKARSIFRQHGGILRMSEAIHAGIHRKMLYAMLDAGIIEKLCRGWYARICRVEKVMRPYLEALL